MTKQLDLFEVPSVMLRGEEGGGLEHNDIRCYQNLFVNAQNGGRIVTGQYMMSYLHT